MARTSDQPVAATPTDSIMPMLAWPSTLAQTFCQAQRAQFEALTTWQQALAGFTQELWDEWTAHWAGGVPLDG